MHDTHICQVPHLLSKVLALRVLRRVWLSDVFQFFTLK